MEQLLNGLNEPLLKLVPKLPEAVLTLAFGYVLLTFVHWLIGHLLRLGKTPGTLQDILHSTSYIVLWAFLALVVARALGFTNLALVLSGSLAVGGIAIAAGANILIQDIIAGLFLAQDKDFEVGFEIETNGITGIIKKVDARKIRLQDSKGRTHVLANSILDRSSWVVIDREPKTQSIK